MSSFERDFLCDGKIVQLRLLPIDEVEGLRRLACVDLHGYSVTQQVVNGLVVSVECATVIVCLSTELVECDADLGWGVAILGQPFREQPLLDVAVTFTVSPIAEGAVSQFVLEQSNDAVLCDTLRLADRTHY